MKILHISTQKGLRGGEHQIIRLYHHILSENQNFMAISQAGKLADWCYDNNIPHFLLRCKKFSAINDALLLNRIIKNLNIDIIHVHDSGAHTLAFLSILLGNKTPIVVSRRVFMNANKSLLSKLKYRSRGISAYIAVSEAVKNNLEQVVNLDTPIYTVYSGVESRIDINKTNARNELKIEEDSFAIGTVSALTEEKNLIKWIELVELIIAKNPNVKGYIIGEGPDRDRLQKMITSKNLVDKIILVGYKSDAKKLLQGFDLYLSASLSEGLGTSILDAMAAQVVVAANLVGGVAEIITDGETGIGVDFINLEEDAHKIYQHISNPSLMNTILENANKQMDKFSVENMAQQTLDVYKKVLG